MRILTWNINGIRTIPQYHPWNTLKDHDDILNKLEADIICFQEMKSSRPMLPKTVALPSSYDSFFSFPVKKSGYSGVATYTRIATVTPLKAEEGLTGLIQPKPPFTGQERVSRIENYPPQLIDYDDLDYKHLDSEGRAVTVDFGLFVLINVYCPNDGVGTDERDKYKMDYHRLLSERVRGLQEEGREVIVLGDINVCAALIDHCEGNIMMARARAKGVDDEDEFWEKEYRRWLRDWLQKEDGTGGPLIDIVRRFWPDRKGMYTCWNTKISARETNYGTRIDYILITPGLFPWIKAADVQQDVRGSDHCPVFVDFHHEIMTQEGKVIRLLDVLGANNKPNDKKEPPRLAARFWEEHSGKQTLLQKFFGKNKGADEKADEKTDGQVTTTLSASQPSGAPSQHNTPEVQYQPEVRTAMLSPSESTQPAAPRIPSLSLEPPASSPTQTSSRVTDAPQSLKRTFTIEIPSTQTSSKKPKPSEKKPDKKGKSDRGQAKLSSFFNKPGPSQPSSSSDRMIKASQALGVDEVDEVCLVHGEAPPSSQNEFSGKTNGDEVKQVWNSLLAPVPPPNCLVHGEPAKEFTVNKPGPNKGKKFYICSRPVGPGWDKGKAERLREEVDSSYRCSFFKWSSEWRKQTRQLNSSTTISSTRPPKKGS